MVSSHFAEEYDPTIEDSYRKRVTIDEESCLLDILDTAGKEEYSAMRDQYYRSGEGFVLIYSITDRSSFEQITTFRDHILRIKDVEFVPIILVGNKIDLEDERQVTKAEGEKLAKELGVISFRIVKLILTKKKKKGFIS